MSDDVAKDQPAAEEKLVEAPRPAPKPLDRERWLPTIAYPYEIDVGTFTLNEQRRVKELSNVPFIKIFDPDHDDFQDVAQATICVAVQRKTPDFTYDEAGDLPPASIKWLMDEAANGEPLLPLGAIVNLSPARAYSSSLMDYIDKLEESEKAGETETGKE